MLLSNVNVYRLRRGITHRLDQVFRAEPIVKQALIDGRGYPDHLLNYPNHLIKHPNHLFSTRRSGLNTRVHSLL